LQNTILKQLQQEAEWSNEYAPLFSFVAVFILCLLVISQGRWKQAPVMSIIAEAGYVVTYL
jgi:uncharacterized membrane protein YjjB (DUF3815 family)